MAKHKRSEEGHGVIPYPKRHGSWARQDLVTILADSEEVPFQVYLSKLEEHSPSILNRIEYSDDVSGQRGSATILMRDIDEQTMDTVVHWLYTGQLCKAEANGNSVVVKAQKEDTDDDEITEHGVVHQPLDEDANTPRESSETPTIAYAMTPAPSTSDSSDSTPIRTSSSHAPTQSSEASAISNADHAPEHAKTMSNLEYTDIFNLYSFALHYDFPALKLEAQKCWQRRGSLPHPQPGPAIISKIFNLPADDISLKRLVARQYALEFCHGAMPETIEKTQEKMMGLHPEFFPLMTYFQACIFQQQLRGARYKTLWCDFHDHKTSEEGRSCMAARKAEVEEMNMRKGKRSWQEAERLLMKIRQQRKVLCEPGNMSKKVSSLNVDGDGIVAGIKGGKD